MSFVSFFFSELQGCREQTLPFPLLTMNNGGSATFLGDFENSCCLSLKHFMLSNEWCLSSLSPFIALICPQNAKSQTGLLWCNFSDPVDRADISGSLADEVECVPFERSLLCFEVVLVWTIFTETNCSQSPQGKESEIVSDWGICPSHND